MGGFRAARRDSLFVWRGWNLPFAHINFPTYCTSHSDFNAKIITFTESIRTINLDLILPRFVVNRIDATKLHFSHFLPLFIGLVYIRSSISAFCRFPGKMFHPFHQKFVIVFFSLFFSSLLLFMSSSSCFSNQLSVSSSPCTIYCCLFADLPCTENLLKPRPTLDRE